jgi:hypothetical protein
MKEEEEEEDALIKIRTSYAIHHSDIGWCVLR